MKLSRRSLFGAAAGAAVAGPGMAKQIVENMSMGGNGASIMGSYAAKGLANYGGSIPQELSPVSEREYLTGCIERAMKNMLAIDEAEETIDNHHRSLVEAQRIDGMRSISPARKASMIVRFRKRLESESEKSFWQREIDDYKKKLGALGYFL